VEGAGYSAIHSREFSTDEITEVGDMINVDLFVPDPQPEPYWVGQAQLYFACDPVIGQTYLGHQELRHTFHDEFNSLLFNIPEPVKTVLLGSHPGCTFQLVLNVNAGSGEFFFDKLGFVGNIISK
jgi:hypothetical protein